MIVLFDFLVTLLAEVKLSSVINILKVIELKKVLAEKFDLNLHIHDGCGGQYFSVQSMSVEGKEYIIKFFEDNNFRAVFNEDDTEFFLEDIRLC